MTAAARSVRDTVRPLLTARQVRQFTEHPLDDEVLDALTDVARWSGSSRNSQPWRFIVIRDRETIAALHEAGKPQTRSLATATAVIAIVLPDEAGQRISHAFDEGRAAERILVAAGMLDVAAGIAWIRADVRDGVRELLGVPDGRTVRTVVALGHPTTEAEQPKTERGEARLPREETVFEERWQD